MAVLDNFLLKLPLILSRIPRPFYYLLSFAFVAIIVKVHPHDGSDFRWYWSLGRAMIDGRNPFVMSELNKSSALLPEPFEFVSMPYPATTGLLMIPFALIDFSLSAYLFKLISTCVLLIGSIRCAQKLQPAAVTVHAVFPIVLLLFFWSPVRWAASNLQLTTLIAGLFGIYLSLPSNKPDKLKITIAVLICCLKFTAVVPLILIFILQKQWRSLAITILITSSLGLVSFLRTGMPNSLFDYVRTLKEFSRFEHPADAISPHVRDAGLRLDLSYFINGFFVNLPNVSYISIVISIVMTIFVLRYGTGDITTIHGKITTLAATGIGLLWTYQHVYAWVMFVPIIVALICEPSWRCLPRSVRYILLLIIIYGFTTATNVTTSLIRSHIGELAVIAFRLYPSSLLLALTVTSLCYIYICRHEFMNQNPVRSK